MPYVKEQLRHFSTQNNQMSLLLLWAVCWVSSNSWQLYEWVTSTMSRPQQPCSTTAGSFLHGFFYGVNPSYIGILFLLPTIFPKLLFYPKNPDFSWCAWSRIASVWSFCLHVSGSMCSRTHSFVFLVVQGLDVLLLFKVCLRSSGIGLFSSYGKSFHVESKLSEVVGRRLQYT